MGGLAVPAGGGVHGMGGRLAHQAELTGQGGARLVEVGQEGESGPHQAGHRGLGGADVRTRQVC